MKSEDPLMTPPEGIPRSTDSIDRELKRGLRQAHHTRWVLVASVFTLLIVAVIYLTVTAITQQKELSASCQMWKILSPLPVTINQQTGAPTRLSVSIIAGARTAYVGQRCGPLPHADSSVTHWSRIYNIPLP